MRILNKIFAALVMLSILMSLSSCSLFSRCAVSETDKYVLYTDIRYGLDKRNCLDMCIPKGDDTELGLLLYIHGGGWKGGDKDVYREMIKDNAARGYATAAINYPYANGGLVTCEDILDDIDLALSKIKETAGEKGVTINKVILSGASAGAHLSLMYGYSRRSSAPICPVGVVSYSGPTDLSDANFFTTVHVDAIKDMINAISGADLYSDSIEDSYEALAAASPISYVDEGVVPTVLCHGCKDDVVPYSNALSLHEALNECGAENYLIIYPNSGHGLESDPEVSAYADDLIYQLIEEWFS